MLRRHHSGHSGHADYTDRTFTHRVHDTGAGWLVWVRVVVPLALAVLGLVLLLALVWTLRDTFDPLAREAREAELYRRQLAQDQVAWLDPYLAGAWKVLPLGLLVALGLAGAVGLYRRLSLVYPRNGAYPVLQRHLGPQLATRFYDVDLARASHQVPQALTYAPHFAYRNDVQGAPPALEAPTVIDVPAFASLLDRGLLGVAEDGRQRPLLLGYTDQGPLEADWKALYSCGLGGLQGSGKTWTAAFLLAQSALNGGRLLVCDPHAGDDESLATRIAPLGPAFLADVASDDRDILAALELAADELDRRKRGSRDRWPLVVAVDEWTSLLRHELRSKLPAYVADFATEGRKYNVHAMLMAQRWSVEAAGGGDVRNTLTAHYTHRTRKDEARMQLGLGPLTPADTITLPPGTAYLLDTRGQLQRVTIPRMTPADLGRVGQLLGGRAPALEAEISRPFGFHPTAREDAGRPAGNHREIKAESSAAALGRDTLPPEDARVITLFLGGMDIPAIVRAVYGVSGGRAYQERAAHVQAVLRRAFGGGV